LFELTSLVAMARAVPRATRPHTLIGQMMVHVFCAKTTREYDVLCKRKWSCGPPKKIHQHMVICAICFVCVNIRLLEALSHEM
jgi:hypothetical protein